MLIRPTVLFEIPPLQDPIAELPASEFHEICVFWPDQFEEIANNRLLIPDQKATVEDIAHLKKLTKVFFCHCHSGNK
jgi:hypothetical protein